MRVITKYEGKRQEGVSTKLITKALEYTGRRQRVLFVIVRNDGVRENLKRRLGGLLGLIPETIEITARTPSPEIMETIAAVFVNDAPFVREVNIDDLIAKYPAVDFYLGTSIDSTEK